MSASKQAMRTVAFAIGLEHKRSEVTAGAIERGRELGWRMLDLACWSMHAPESCEIDGLIADLSGHSHVPDAKRLLARYPISVSLGYTYGVSTVPRVERDDRLVGIRGAEHLLDRGFNHFVVAFYEQEFPENTILNAFKERVSRAGGTCANLPPLEKNEEIGYARQGQLFRQQLRGLKFPLGIFCRNDRLAARVCYWCFEEGLIVPEQVAVLGVGNDPLFCECNPVPISSVDSGNYHRGVEAASLLQRMMDGEPPPAEPVLVPPGEVITRRSTDIIAIPDLPTARALRYIWDYYRKDLGVKDVADASGVSRRTLGRHFKAALGLSINQELTRTRLQKAAKMLSTTEIPAEDVASLVGFRTAQYFSLRFRERFGLPPSDYRQQQRRKPPAG